MYNVSLALVLVHTSCDRVRVLCASLFLCPQVYGGYLATMLLSSEDFTQLKCGVAVSPITDFELYGLSEPLPRHTVCLSVHLSVCTSILCPVTLSVCTPVCLCLCPVTLSVCTSALCSVTLSVCTTVCTITLSPITLCL